MKNAPSARRREIAGAVDARPPAELSAALSVSGRTPSAMMMMTGTSIQIQEGEFVETQADEAALRKARTEARFYISYLLAKAPLSPIDLSGISVAIRGPSPRSSCHTNS